MPEIRYSSSGRPLVPEEDIPLRHNNNSDGGDGTTTTTDGGMIQSTIPLYFYVLPVLLMEFLSLAFTRAILPGVLLKEFGNNVYLILGMAECIRGCLAFFACPLFGQISDHLGRKPCLFVTVLGTCAPVCSLALWSWEAIPTTTIMDDTMKTVQYDLVYPQQALGLFVILLAISGLTSSTFTLVFCYISDTVVQKDDRLSAYGLALATFGLSFTLGTLCGGYLAETRNPANVFRASCILTLLDLIYILWILPESKRNNNNNTQLPDSHTATTSPLLVHGDSSVVSTTSVSTTKTILVQQLTEWKPWRNLRETLWRDPFLRNVGIVAFLYYTGLSAVISTISLYAVSHFHLSPQHLGELMSALGACTMFAEAVLVRYLVPYWGERTAIRMGLLSFALQCLVLGIATQPWQLFICVGFSLLANLVYPSLTSLVTELVEPVKVGEALGSLNGVKALTEGIGPLVFGFLFTWSEDIASRNPYIPPGWPYCIAALIVLGAYHVATDRLPHESEEYVHELEFKKRNRNKRSGNDFVGGGNEKEHPQNDGVDDRMTASFNPLACISGLTAPPSTTIRDDEEYQDLLPYSLEESRYEDMDDDGDKDRDDVDIAVPPHQVN